MSGLILWKNQEINKLRREMDHLLDRLEVDFCMPLSLKSSKEIPVFDLFETEENLIIRAEAPDISPKNLDISITNDTLTIKGKVEQKILINNLNYHKMKKKYSSFSRTIQLPCHVVIDKIEATCEKGFLKIVMPKYRPEKISTIKIYDRK